ncbi:MULTISPECIES: 3-hydroxybutyryl-CoA dehydrogenase [Pseudoflavonifractor]|uniref:3-hydroxybutyryl-CoA dehydrogenase n=1 Tax=Candidatus Enterenecus faecium TaxID=2840780 RepID=A0A9D0YTH6_9FIRM|nr:MULTISPECIES: 3-hydroxybutyryl-CoA dehydrogenase [Pseudoflavonifractor]HIQ61036.1 3-hydroxybutyryl-CoA dehydrogenase [Candidatus Enterenecus faecium]MBM6694158.1 3-hydroxybutyryl-CoA dehydrogenase [Pseudoflavonifractor capillosus]OUN25526.1 3-hydroxybutyryl-CoA dehydrogenase [Pseudoflavonifractor sp. An85]OUN94738.1 3-hydroxybutyryl-CoA dehydrogenase [Pseudoflavonifractor sp. An44]OUP44230.1 3-hydroxybutyryl-CoA dehydrogenase [Pseudoflavonifractor sp. An187]
MKKVVVIGGGTMGLDIAQVFARKGFDVVVRDIKDEIIQASEARLNKGLDKLVAKGKMDEAGKQAILDKMSFTTDLNAAADADLVVEAAIENLEIKKSIFAELDAICKPETILASNTSSISITAIAAATKRPDRFIGMHFFNPATVMKLVEVIRGANTSDETYKAIYDLSVEIGKEPVEVNEAPGFVVNKILIPMINEACDLLYTGVATAEGIDTAMKLGANHPMGPLALGDLVGLDVCLAIMDTLYNETHDPKYRASLLMRKMVRAGHLGRKTGKGFFDYTKK